jgi:hypothetical protein
VPRQQWPFGPSAEIVHQLAADLGFPDAGGSGDETDTPPASLNDPAGFLAQPIQFAVTAGESTDRHIGSNRWKGMVFYGCPGSGDKIAPLFLRWSRFHHIQ